jgi:hypothetical protein
LDLLREDSNGTVAEVPGTPIEEWARCVRSLEPDLATPPGTGRVIRLEHPALGPALLTTAWQSHVGMRDAIMTWVRQLADHEDAGVRIAAAQIAGKLATYDFTVIRTEILTAWAASGKFSHRQAVACAVEPLAQQKLLSGRVRKMVRGWASGLDPSRCAAAIAVYGTGYGASYPDEAIDGMTRIARSRVLTSTGRRARDTEQALARAISRSMTEMFAAGADAQVVSALHRWTLSDAWLLRWAAARSLTRLARQGGNRPALLVLAGQQPKLRDAIVELWRTALVEGESVRDAWNALRYWVTDADAGPAGDWLRELVAVLGADPRVGGRLHYHVTLWEFQSGRRISVIPHDLRMKWRKQ